MTQPERFTWTHPAPAPRPTAPARPPAYPVPAYGPPVRYVTKSKRHTSHAFHLIMTIVTCGLWLPVWVWMTWQNIVIRERTTTRGR